MNITDSGATSIMQFPPASCHFEDQSSGPLRRVFWSKFADVQEVLAAFIFKACTS